MRKIHKMPQYLKVKQLYVLCLELFSDKILQFCKNIHRSSVWAKYEALMSAKKYLAENLSNCILNDILEYNLKSDSSTDAALVQYYFFQIVTHNQLGKFSGKYIELSTSYWRCLFEDNFSNLKILNLALCCDDVILEMIPKYCPNLEYLNATSKYLFRDVHSAYRNYNRKLQLPVSDTGLCHLKSCKRLRILIINEPRGEHSIATNQITYNGLRYLLRHVNTLEDISYSDLGYVITTIFSDISSLNLTTVRHIHPTASTIRQIFGLCTRISSLNLNGSSLQTIEAVDELINEICSAQRCFKKIEFQNIYFGQHFERFFHKFGNNLVSLSISFSQAEINFEHIVVISLHCPNLHYFLCNNLLNTASFKSTPRRHFRPFSGLRSLHLSGHCIDIEKILRYCTEYAINLEVLKLHELKGTQNFQNVVLNCMNAPNLRLLEFSRIICSRNCIERIIEKFCFMNFLIVQSNENCREIIDRIRSQNYDLVFIIQSIESNPLI